MKRQANESKVDVLGEIAEAVKKKYGEGSISLLSDSSEFAEVKDFLSTGNWALNRAISGRPKGGVPGGRLTEIYGKESTGKTLVITHIIAECQKAGGVAVLDDTEHAYLKGFGEMVGINHNELLYSDSTTVEEVFDKMIMVIPLLRKKYPNVPILYAWDSLALTGSEQEQDKTTEDGGGFDGAKKAQSIHIGARKVVGLVNEHNIHLVIANHTRKRMGVMFGDDETTPGGDAVPFWASVRMRLSRVDIIRAEKDKKSSPIIGIRVKALMKKNKINKPFQECEFDIIFDTGITYASGCVDSLVNGNIVIHTGAGWYELPDGQKFQGKEKVDKYYNDNPSKLDEIDETAN